MAQARLIFLPRDQEVLVALARGPLVAEQLLRISKTFSRPFRDIRRVRERLADLAGAGLVCRRPMASEAGSGRTFYTLGNQAIPLLYGDARRRIRCRSPLSLARARHTFHLSEFVVHLHLGAARRGVEVTGFGPEGSVRLAVEGESVIPDGSFVVCDGHRSLNFFLEIDEGTERLTSDRADETWDRKLRLYEAFQDMTKEKRFRVLVATTAGLARVAHILERAKHFAKNPERSLVLTTTLSAFLMSTDPLGEAVFRDHRDNLAAMLPPAVAAAPPPG